MLVYACACLIQMLTVNVAHGQAREVLRVAQAEGKGTEEAERQVAAAVNAMDEASEIKRKVY